MLKHMSDVYGDVIWYFVAVIVLIVVLMVLTWALGFRRKFREWSERLSGFGVNAFLLMFSLLLFRFSYSECVHVRQ